MLEELSPRLSRVPTPSTIAASAQEHRPDGRPSAVVLFSVSAADMAAFRLLSGDHNPLHHDSHFAAARGFDAPVVYGGLLVAKVSGLLGSALPGSGCVWQSMRLDFRAPLYVGRQAKLTGEVTHANPELGLWRIALAIREGSTLIAQGEAQAIRRLPGGPAAGADA
jgi:3-hydroxybutyryl-CoA dehydratase